MPCCIVTIFLMIFKTDALTLLSISGGYSTPCSGSCCEILLGHGKQGKKPSAQKLSAWPLPRGRTHHTSVVPHRCPCYLFLNTCNGKGFSLLVSISSVSLDLPAGGVSSCFPNVCALQLETSSTSISIILPQTLPIFRKEVKDSLSH